MKTNLRKELDREISSKLLLKDATTWQIIRQLYRRFDTEVWMIAAFGLLAYEVWNKLG